MNEQLKLNSNSMKSYLDMLDNDIIEVRIFGFKDPNIMYRGKKQWLPKGSAIGYYDRHGVDQLIEDVRDLNKQTEGIYTSIHQFDPALLSRSYNKMTFGKIEGTKDNNITHFNVFPIDIDSTNPRGTTASDSEVKASQQVALEIVTNLMSNGITPITGFSGNGYHILIPINTLEVNDETSIRWKTTGDLIADHFNTDHKVYSISRVWKLYETMVCKGDEVPSQERYYRKAQVNIPKEIVRYTFDQVEKWAAQFKDIKSESEVKKPQVIKAKAIATDYNYLPDFCEKHNITILETKEDATKTTYRINCPFVDHGENDLGGTNLFQNKGNQFGDSKVFACHHNSCRDKKWADFKGLYEEPKQVTRVTETTKPTAVAVVEPVVETEETDYPVVSLTSLNTDGYPEERPIREVSREIRGYIEDRDPSDELFFVRQDEIGFLKKKTSEKQVNSNYSYNETTMIFKPISKGQMKSIINEVIDFEKQTWAGGRKNGFLKTEKLKGVPSDIAEDVQVKLDFNKLPWIEHFLSRPLIDRSYNLINEGGYHQETGFYLDKERLPNIDENLTLTEAKDILEDWLEDFNFASDADFANAIALGLTLILRSSFPYGVLPPLFLITSANPGSGKSTLANLIGLATSGQMAGATSISKDDEEMRKHLTAEVKLGSEFVIFDNAKKQNTIDCGALASSVTEAKLRGRELGESNIISGENNLTVCFTGNKIKASTELVDRALFIELDSDKRAAEREFKTNTIVTDTIINRDKIFSAFYTFFRVWQEDGCQKHEKPKHRQKEWHAVIGGIMSHAAKKLEIEAYNAIGENYAKHKRQSDPAWLNMSAFMRVLVELQNEDPGYWGIGWSANDVLEIASHSIKVDKGTRYESGEDILENDIEKIDKTSDNKTRTRYIGNYLTDCADGVYGMGDDEHKLIITGKKKAKNRYLFVKTGDNADKRESSYEELPPDNRPKLEATIKEYLESNLEFKRESYITIEELRDRVNENLPEEDKIGEKDPILYNMMREVFDKNSETKVIDNEEIWVYDYLDWIEGARDVFNDFPF